MATNRLESAKESGEPRAPAPASEAAPVPAGGIKPWVPLLATLVVMPLLAYGVTTYVLLPKLQKGLNISVAGESPSRSGGDKGGAETGSAAGKKEVVTLNKLLVNVAGTMGARYLLTTLALAGSDPDLKAKVQQHEAQLRDMAGGALATKTIADIEKPGARNLIRSELITGFNNILGGPVVEEIYFTEFAIQ